MPLFFICRRAAFYLVVTPMASSSTFLSLSWSFENFPSLTLNLTIFISLLDFRKFFLVSSWELSGTLRMNGSSTTEDLLPSDLDAWNIFSIWLLYFFYFLRFLRILRRPLLLFSFLDFLLCFTDDGSTDEERSEESPSIAWSVSAGGLLGSSFFTSNGLEIS